MPEAWRSLPAYRMTAGSTFQLDTLRRGVDPDEPSQLRLQRQLWLDFDGEGYSVRDQISGELRSQWRLETGEGLDLGQALRAQRKIKGKATVESSVRVSTSRLDRLIDMVGELVIAHSMVAQDEVITDSQNHELAKKVSHTSKIVRGLQDMSMSMRMVPLKGAFNKMARLVRDLSKKVGKMSKRLRNYRSPGEIFDRYGADALRWYFFAGQPPWNSIVYGSGWTMGG